MTEEIGGSSVPGSELSKPASSTAVVLDDGQNYTIVLPPNGFRAGARRLLIFSIAWMLIINGIIATILLASTGVIGGNVNIDNLGVVILVLTGFEAAGVGLLIAAIHSAKQKTVLIVSQGELLFSQVSPIRNSEQRWSTGVITNIACGESGTVVNDVPLMQLKITTSDNDTRSILTGRDPEELHWLAQELKRAIS